MSINRTLTQTLCISLCLSLPLSILAIAEAPASVAAPLLYLMLLPLGVAAPLLAGGCLLHERLLRRAPRAAKTLARAGRFLAGAAAAGLLWLRVA